MTANGHPKFASIKVGNIRVAALLGIKTQGDFAIRLDVEQDGRGRIGIEQGRDR